MSLNEPLIPGLSRRVLADVNRAVQGFARAHKYQIGADLRREAVVIARAADKAWYRPAERAYWVSELVDGVDNLKVTMQLAKDLKLRASLYRGILPTLSKKTGVGFDSLIGAAMSRMRSAERLFSCLVVPYGRAGRESREALPVLHRSVNPFGPSTRLTAGDGSQSELEHTSGKPKTPALHGASSFFLRRSRPDPAVCGTPRRAAGTRAWVGVEFPRRSRGPHPRGCAWGGRPGEARRQAGLGRLVSDRNLQSPCRSQSAHRHVGAQLMSARPPASIRAGISDARGLLFGLRAMVKAQTRLRGDMDLAEATAMVLQHLPKPDSPEAVGFAIVMAEYLALIADGVVIGPDFTLAEPRLWKRFHNPEAAYA